MKTRRLSNKEFKLPTKTTIGGRKSTLAKAFSDGIAPRKAPTEAEYNKYLSFFKKKNGYHLCAYCGAKYDYFEHFRPLVKKGKPTGYGSDIYNLVPSCSSCNVGKGNLDWNKWMGIFLGKQTPNKSEHKRRVDVLKKYENWCKGRVKPVNYEKLVGKKLWNKYLADYEILCSVLGEMHKFQKEIDSAVKKAILQFKI